MHDGSESSPDAIIFEIELKSGSDLPREMRVRQRFRLQISIRPVNDPPQIGLTVKSLKIAEGTAKVLTDDLIKVVDPDNSRSEIVVSLVPARDEAVPGHIENERFPGQARDSFSLEDLFQGRVSFVHHVSRFTYIRVPVKKNIYLLLNMQSRAETKNSPVTLIIGKLARKMIGLLVSLRDEPKHCQKIVKIQRALKKKNIFTAGRSSLASFKVSFTVIFAEGANKSWKKSLLWHYLALRPIAKKKSY